MIVLPKLDGRVGGGGAAFRVDVGEGRQVQREDAVSKLTGHKVHDVGHGGMSTFV